MIVKPGIPENLKWFQDARFGMMIHFGVYSLLGRGEWVMYSGHIPREDYEALSRRFDPFRFDADEWVDFAIGSGCRYITFTAKHHDGFCMWDSAFTDYKITNTPFGRDLMGELIGACHRRELPIIVYYSQPDWHHKNYVNIPGAFKDLAEPPPDQQPDWPKYRQYLFDQVEEICTKYGRIDGIFFDGSHKSEETWGGRELYALIKRYQPDAVVNDRARCGDMYTPERAAVEIIDRRLAGKYLLDICTSVTLEGWGYVTYSDLTTVDRHIEQMVKAARIGCNYALNIGPSPDGALPARSQTVFRQIGRWMERHAEGYRGTRPHYPKMPEDRYVMLGREDWLYLFCLKWPDTNSITIPGLRTTCRRVTLLSVNEPVSFRREGDDLILSDLPLSAPDSLVQCFRIELDAEPDLDEKAPIPEKRIVVKLSDERETVLTPQTASMEGFGVKGKVLEAAARTVGEMSDSAAEEGKTLEKCFIVGWMTPDQHAVWHVEAARETVCRLRLEFLSDSDYPDTEATIRVNGQPVTFAVPEKKAGGIVPVEVGSFTFKAGLNTVDLNASKPKWGYLFPPVGGLVLSKI